MFRSPAVVLDGCRKVLRTLWFLEESRRWLIVDIFLLSICLFETLLLFHKTCVLSSEVFSPSCIPYTKSLVIIQIVKVLVGNIMVAQAFNDKLSTAIPLQLGLTKDGSKTFQTAWAAVSSLDVFEGIVKVSRASHLQVMVFVAMSALVTTAASLPSDISRWSSSEGKAFFEAVCKSNFHDDFLCHLSWLYCDTLAVVCCGIAVYGVVMTRSLKLEMWSPIFVRACEKTRSLWLKRCLWAHWSSHVSNISAFVVYVIFVRMKFLKATRLEMQMYPCGVLFVIVFLMSVISLNFELDRVCWRQLRSCGCGCHARIMPCVDSCNQSSQLVPGSHSSGMGVQSDSSRRQLWRSLFTTDYSGFRHWQLTILMPLMYTTIPTAFGSPFSLLVLWIIRLIYITALLCTRDRLTEFNDLEESGAGFGLVVDAEHLRNAVIAWLDGKIYKGPMHKYRASYFRMQDTLCVSYRWKEDESKIHADVVLNMSVWQLTELAKAIKESKCLYVWMDKLSVPQRSCKLQTTLLARMMAVYATSKETLVLRSVENNGNRYHQRAWTLQEYCCSRQLRLVTEPLEACCQAWDEENSLMAVTDEEENLFPTLREWHQARGSDCRPFWLYGLDDFSNRVDVHEICERICALSSRLVCQIPADRVRALYPMLFNVPLENEKELVQLVSKAEQLARELCNGSMCDASQFQNDRCLVEASLARSNTLTEICHRE